MSTVSVIPYNQNFRIINLEQIEGYRKHLTSDPHISKRLKKHHSISQNITHIILFFKQERRKGNQKQACF